MRLKPSDEIIAVKVRQENTPPADKTFGFISGSHASLQFAESLVETGW